MPRLEKRKLEWFIKQGGGNDEDLNFFWSLVLYVKQIPPTKKLFLRSQFQNVLADEISALQNNLLHAWASSSAPSSNSFEDGRHTESYYVHICYRCNNTVVWCQEVINLTDLLQLLVWFCYSRGRRHSYSFIHSYCSYCKSCNHDTVFALISLHVLFLSTSVLVIVVTNVAVFQWTKLASSRNWKEYLKCEACWTYLSVINSLFSMDIVFWKFVELCEMCCCIQGVPGGMYQTSGECSLC